MPVQGPDGGEAARISIALDEARRWGAFAPGSLPVLVGAEARDDCAILGLTTDRDLVIGSDFIRGTGFYLFKEGILSLEDVGWYLVAANVSDLAAMGATPSGIVVANRYSSEITAEEWRSVCRGIARACGAFHVPLLGGDTGGYSVNVLSATAIGTVHRGRALLRSGGRPGDRLFVMGTIGAAGAAVAFFCRARHRGIEVAPAIQERLAASWRQVSPAVEQGIWLTEHALSRCALDTSDGLKAALCELAARSEVDIVVALDAVPVDSAALAVAEAMQLFSLDLAMSESVDFRLVFTVAEENVARVQHGFAQSGWELHEIGYLRGVSGDKPSVVSHMSAGNNEVPGLIWDQSDVPTIDRLLARMKPR